MDVEIVAALLGAGAALGATADVRVGGSPAATRGLLFAALTFLGGRALEAKPRARRGGHTKLSDAQQQRIAKLVGGKNPDQLKLPGFLWTRALVRDLIGQQLGIEVGDDTVGRYLRAWGMSPQKPMRRAYEQSDEAVRRWLEVECPALVKRAYRERAEILWADESGLRSDHTAGRTWAPIGQTPVATGTGKRFKANMIAAIRPPRRQRRAFDNGLSTAASRPPTRRSG